MLYVFTANRTKRSLAEKAQNLDFSVFFSSDKACAAVLYVYTASCTERSITEKRHEITRETLCRSPHP